MGYSLPTLSLSQSNCTHIQAPALQATLSKLHLNRNISRAIVFGPATYGGLSLPDQYTSAGISQLHLLLGHLCLQDKTAKLLLIDISYLQLLVGSSTLFLNLQYSKYANFTDQGWLITVWKFLNKVNMHLHIRQAFNPVPPRQHDSCIMDYCIQHYSDCTTLRTINRCRIYLQVIFLSDICSADGTLILPECIGGSRPKNRKSILEWPVQPRPPQPAWRIWSTMLAALHVNNNLHNPLGKWTSPTYQKWHSLYHPTTHDIYHETTENNWMRYSPILIPSTHNTRSSKRPWYSMLSGSNSQPPPVSSVPATLHINQLYSDDLFQIDCSPTKLISL